MQSLFQLYEILSKESTLYEIPSQLNAVPHKLVFSQWYTYNWLKP